MITKEQLKNAIDTVRTVRCSKDDKCNTCQILEVSKEIEETAQIVARAVENIIWGEDPLILMLRVLTLGIDIGMTIKEVEQLEKMNI